MNIEKLKELKVTQEELNNKENLLKHRKEVFEQENLDLMHEINYLKSKVTNCKEILTENAEAGYLKDNKKVRLGGVTVWITKHLDYDDKDAFNWAIKHQMCLELNKKEFEQIAKIQKLDFVKNSEKIKVTFPKEIKLDEVEK